MSLSWRAKFFATLYDSTDKKEIYTSRLLSALNSFMIQHSKLAETVIENWSASRGWNRDTAAANFFDSTLYYFVQNDLWKEHSDKERYMQMFMLYGSHFCPCISEKAAQAGSLTENSPLECTQTISGNPMYRDSMLAMTRGISPADQERVSEMASMYVYQHCPVFRNYIDHILRTETLGLFSNMQTMAIQDADKNLLEAYDTHSPKLTQSFPYYKRDSLHILAFKRISQGKEPNVMSDDSIRANGQVYVKKYLYRYNNEKVELYGQVNYVLERVSVTPVILSFRFIPMKEMKDREIVKKKIKDNLEDIPLPPPPPADFKLIGPSSPKKN